MRGSLHDMVGIGFGPANLALAVALEDAASPSLRRWSFIESQARFSWHEGMLLPDARMQISFLKDLATARDPQSRFTFLNYLRTTGRIRGFINQQCFFPSRHEFQAYLRWAAARISAPVHYGHCVRGLEPIRGNDGRVVRLRVLAEDRMGKVQTLPTRGVVIATGGKPHIPEVFRGVAQEPGMIHSAHYLHKVAGLPHPPARIAVIGAGQSAAETFLDLHARFPEAQIDLLHRGLALRVADDSPFVNEIFEPDMVDLLYGQSAAARAEFLAVFRHTNYAAIDAALLRRLSMLLYEQRVAGNGERIRVCARRTISEVVREGPRLVLESRDDWANTAERSAYDLLVLATGYDRDGWRELLEPLRPWLGSLSVRRDYRLAAEPDLAAPIFVQGGAEGTHGIGDSLLSHLPERAEIIRAALQCGLDEETGHHAVDDVACATSSI